MAWIIAVDGVSLEVSCGGTDSDELREMIEADAEYRALVTASNMPTGFFAGADTDSENNKITVFVGAELLSDRYICKGETVTLSPSTVELRQVAIELAEKLEPIVSRLAEGLIVTKRIGVVLNHFD